MSMILMAQAMKLKIGNSARKFVLIKLADNANDKGECWPSYQHIADHCELGRSTVKAHIEALTESGFIKKFERNNGKSSNKYVLTLEDGDQQERVKPNRSGNLAQPLTGSTADTPCTAADTPLAQPLIPEPVIEAIKEPITFMSPTGSTAPDGADSVCSACNGEKRVLVKTQANGMTSTSFRDCNHCKGTGKEPTCNAGSPVPTVKESLIVESPEITFPAFRVCDKCGNKRCPHAHDERDDCTGSNELGQVGSFTGYCVHPDRFAEQPTKADKPLNVPFDDFWNLYNKKVGRKKSETKWKRLSNKDRAAIMEHLPNYIRNTPDVQYRKNPETYLNSESWNDELPNMRKPGRPDYPENQGVDKAIHFNQMKPEQKELTSEQQESIEAHRKALRELTGKL